MSKDYYKLLGVEKNASEGDLKKAFRKLSMEYHPDRNPDNPEAENKFKEINEAYSTLSDPQKRSKYDNPNPMRGFGDIFGGMGGFSQQRQKPNPNRPMRGRDLKFVVDVPLSKFIFGGEETFRPTYNDACPNCSGKGYKKAKECSNCGGMGVIIEERSINGMQMRSQTGCPTCRGRGEVPTELCESCGGKGNIRISKDTTVLIQPGSRDGDIIGRGGEGGVGLNGGPKGNLHIKLRMDMPPADKFNEEEKGKIIDLFA